MTSTSEDANSNRISWANLTASDAISAAAAASVAITGMLYFAGYSARSAIMYMIGLPDESFQLSIQATLANGYLPILGVAMVFFIVIMIFYGPGSKIGHRKRKWLIFYGDNPISIDAIFTSIMLLSAASGAGLLFGLLYYISVSNPVHNGCARKCFIYDDGTKGIVGIAVARDEKHTAVLASSGVWMLDTDKVMKISPYPRSSKTTYQRKSLSN